MDDRIRHIIESGLLESYLLNLTTESETQEIDQLLTQSDDLRQAFEELENMQFAMTETIAVKPPSHLKTSIQKAIQEEISTSSKTEAIVGKTSQDATSGKTWLWLALLMISVAWGVYTFLQNKDLKKQQQELLVQLDELQQTRLEINSLLLSKDAQLAFINNTKTKKLNLQGNALASQLNLIAYWNDELKKSLLSVIDLPPAPKGKCYQMWADVKGEMLDLGVVNISNGIINWKYLENAESLNVTIEPKGGSKHPTVANLVANINV